MSFPFSWPSDADERLAKYRDSNRYEVPSDEGEFRKFRMECNYYFGEMFAARSWAMSSNDDDIPVWLERASEMARDKFLCGIYCQTLIDDLREVSKAYKDIMFNNNPSNFNPIVDYVSKMVEEHGTEEDKAKFKRDIAKAEARLAEMKQEKQEE